VRIAPSTRCTAQVTELQAYAAADPLITDLRTSDNWHDLPAIWTAWQDATDLREQVVRREQRARAIGVGQTLQQTVTVVRYTLTTVGGGTDSVWLVRETFDVAGEVMAARKSAHADEAAAAAEAGFLLQGDEPAYTLDEVATLTGRQSDALRQAMHRARRDGVRGVPHPIGRPPGVYSLAHIRRFLDSRPGHGPGRGRKRTR
jgi:hypothetical protein